MANPAASVSPVTTTIQHQETPYYCGASCAQSVLSELGIMRKQSTLYRHIKETRTIDRGPSRIRWFSSPDGLTNALNWYHKKFNLPPGVQRDFELFECGGKKAVARRMIWALNKFNQSCINLILGADHWITISGYQLDLTKPTRNNIVSFYVNDPLAGEPGHTQGDISYDIWQFTKVFQIGSGYWINKFLAICDPDPKKNNFENEKSSKMPKQNQQPTKGEKPSVSGSQVPNELTSSIITRQILTTPEKNPPTLSFTKDPVSGTKNIIDEPTAKTYAEWWLRPGGFYDPKMFKLYMPNLRSGSPVLVQELGTQDLYYLIPLTDINNKVYAIMSISAKDAAYREFTTSTNIKESFSFKPLTEKKIKDLIKEKYGLTKAVKEMTIHKTLVWKYCKKSLSVYRPFYMVTIGKRIVYIRFDKEIFTRLT
ncbi:MAG TPA: hypothetical protein VFI33_18665 [Puia sp.]|nr:hypothetical protein [Puia sp.]